MGSRASNPEAGGGLQTCQMKAAANTPGRQGLRPLTGLCLGQRRTCVPCRPRTGWTVATPRSAPSSVSTGAAALTPASPRCLGASSLCRTQVRGPASPVSLPAPPREASRAPGSRAYPGGTASTVTVHRGGGLSQRRRAQGGQLPGAVPCRPFARRFVRTMKAVVSKRCSKSRHCVQGTSLKTILERSGKHTGLGSWADIRGLARQTKHRHL